MSTEDAESHTFEIYPGKTNIHGFENPRLGFIQKVYGILSCQLIFTSIFVLFAQTSGKAFFSPAYYSVSMPLFYLAVIGALVTNIMVACYTSLARTVPTNYVLLSIFTVCEAYCVAFTTTFYSPTDVLLAAFLTCTLTLVLTFYAYTTKKDFTLYGGILWTLSWGLFAVSILLSLMFWGNYQALNTLNIFLSVFAVILYGVYLIYDTQIIIGGGKFELTLDDYVIGAMVIYIDIIILFLRILRILASLKQRN